MGAVNVLSHPLILDKLSIMRDKRTSCADFRRLLREITLLMGYEVTADLPTRPALIETPVATAEFPVLASRAVTIVPILRAGLGMVEGLLELLPFASVGHLGMERDEVTHEPSEYYSKLPRQAADSLVIVVDPMLATGGSAIDAVANLKQHGCTDLRMLNLLAAPEGIAAFGEAHPDVDIFVAAIDERLNGQAYIVPGLGDAGDRIFSTL